MKISWLGHAMFEIVDEKSNLTIVTDPYGEEVGYPLKKRKADVVTISHEHFDHNNRSIVEASHVLSKRGEFEINGVKISAIESFHDEAFGKKRGTNLIFKIEGEFKLAHLGDYGEPVLREEIGEFLKDLDVLFVPVGGTFTIGPQEASKLVEEVNPKIVIPMHYKTPHLKFELLSEEHFLKVSGRESLKLDVLYLKNENLKDYEGKVVLLDYWISA